MNYFPLGGGVITDDATATASQILSGYTAYVKGKKITGNIPSQGAQTITPGTSDKTIASGKYLSGTQTIRGDSNLVAGNIKKGTSIFGISGTYTSDANATAANILSGKTAYVNGSKITGSMKSNNYGDHALSDGINDKGYYMYFTDGYYPHDGWKGGWVYRTRAETAKSIGLTAAKLASGQTVLGIKGTYSGPTRTAIGVYRKSQNSFLIWEGGSNFTGASSGFTCKVAKSYRIRLVVQVFGGSSTSNCVIYVKKSGSNILTQNTSNWQLDKTFTTSIAVGNVISVDVGGSYNDCLVTMQLT